MREKESIQTENSDNLEKLASPEFYESVRILAESSAFMGHLMRSIVAFLVALALPFPAFSQSVPPAEPYQAAVAELETLIARGG